MSLQLDRLSELSKLSVMSLDQDGYRWCDKCWDNQATAIAWNVDGSRTDLCDEHKDMAEKGAYLVEVASQREGWR